MYNLHSKMVKWTMAGSGLSNGSFSALASDWDASVLTAHKYSVILTLNFGQCCSIYGKSDSVSNTIYVNFSIDQRYILGPTYYL